MTGWCRSRAVPAKPGLSAGLSEPGRFEPSESEVARTGRTPAHHGGMQERFAGPSPAATMPTGRGQLN
jgi:hypothetical protein